MGLAHKRSEQINLHQSIERFSLPVLKLIHNLNYPISSNIKRAYEID